MAPISPSFAHLFVLYMTAFIVFMSPIAARHHYKHTKLTIFMHSAINVTDFIPLPGIVGLGSGTLTATAAQFGSMFVFNSPLTSSIDPHSPSVGNMQGTGVTTAFDGTKFFIASTATLNTTKYDGMLNILGISGGKIPISGGTDDFLFVQGYSVTTRAKIVDLNTTYKIDLYLYWPSKSLI